MENVDKKVTAIFNSVSKAAKTHSEFQQKYQQQHNEVLDKIVAQSNQQQLTHTQTNEFLNGIQDKLEAQLKQFDQQQLVQTQTNELLNDIHTTLKENAASAKSIDDSLGNEIKGVLGELKSSLARTQQTRNKQSAPNSSPVVNRINNNRGNSNATVITEIVNGRQQPTLLVSTQLNPDSKQIVVSNLYPSITSDQLVQYVKTKLDTSAEQANITARALVPKNKSVNDLNFVSIYLAVPATLYQAIMNPGMWPKGASVRDFEDRPSKKRQSGVFLSLWTTLQHRSHL